MTDRDRIYKLSKFEIVGAELWLPLDALNRAQAIGRRRPGSEGDGVAGKGLQCLITALDCPLYSEAYALIGMACQFQLQRIFYRALQATSSDLFRNISADEVF